MKKIVLSLGGSLIVPEKVEGDFLSRFHALVSARLSDTQFVIFTGGGNTARLYQDGLRAALSGASDAALDWIGIHSSRLNAQLVKTMFGEQAANEIIVDPTLQLELNTPVRIGAGWKPGWSTDYDAVAFAAGHRIERVVNLSNIKFAYDKDPNQFDDAQPIEETTWEGFRKIVGDEWKPGLNMPFDPIASKLAQEKGIEVVIAQGTNLPNLEAILDGGDFEGTTIRP
jgi:uridylate kinase